MRRRTTAVLAAVGILGFSTFAHATHFDITDANFSNLVGNTSGFTWTVTPKANIAPFDLAAGESKIFTYGTFSTTDIADAKKINDSFTASFFVSPPGTAQQVTEILNSIHIHGNNYGVQISGDNPSETISFGSGGKYTLSFLDPAELDTNGSVELQAKICLQSEFAPAAPDPDPPAPVPEPGTVALLAAGFGCLGFFRKFRKI